MQNNAPSLLQELPGEKTFSTISFVTSKQIISKKTSATDFVHFTFPSRKNFQRFQAQPPFPVQASGLTTLSPIGSRILKCAVLFVTMAWPWARHWAAISESSQPIRSEEHTSELQSRQYLVCR